MAAADDFPDLYYPDNNGDFAWDSPCWNNDWEYDLIGDGHKTLQEWNKENRTIAKGEEGIYLPCAKKTVFDKAQTIPIHKNNYTPMYFKTHDEAISWAKNNPDKVITRSNDGIGYIEKKITTETNIRENNIQTFSTHKDITFIGDLMWEKETREMTWHKAMEYANNLRLGGYDDWRLPTLEEIRDVVRLCGGVPPRWDEQIENNMNNEAYQASYKEKGFTFNCYWSSTTAKYTFNAWLMEFYGGCTFGNGKTNIRAVRCVR